MPTTLRHRAPTRGSDPATAPTGRASLPARGGGRPAATLLRSADDVASADPLQTLLAASVARRARTALLQREPVPTAEAPAAEAAPAAAPATAAAKPPEPQAPGGSARSRTFFTANAEMLRKLPATDAELLFLLDEALDKGSDTVLDIHSYNWDKSWRGVPLIHRLFMRRNPGVEPLISLPNANGKGTYAVTIDSWEKVATSSGGWEKIGVTAAHWAEIKKIRDKIVFPLMRIVLPRTTKPGALAKDASVGERIAHRAYTYLGVRYVYGGNYQGANPEAADPELDKVNASDCAALVRRVFDDIGLKVSGTTGGGPAGDHVVHASAEWITVPKPTVATLAPGDLLISDSHIAIFVGDGSIIHAPHTGRVVSKDKISSVDKYPSVRRYAPKAAPATAAP